MTPVALPSQGDTEEPWEANLCFTVKATSADEVDRLLSKLNAYARRIGVGDGFTDYSAAQPEDGPHRGAS